MKKIMLAVLALGFVVAVASGCSQEKSPVQTEPAAMVQAPAQEAAPEIAVKTDVAAPFVQDAVKDLEKSLTVEGVTSAAQSSTQALVREGNATVGGVTSSAQSSTQTLVREGNTVVGGVTSAAQASSQAGALEEGALAEKVQAADSAATDPQATAQQ